MTPAEWAIVETRAEAAEDALAGNDTQRALEILTEMVSALTASTTIDSMPKTVLILANGNSFAVATSTNTAADIAGLMNAGTPKVYAAVDITDGLLHHILVSTIVDVFETP